MNIHDPIIINAVERSIANPETFQVPDVKDIQEISVTDSVKICVEAPERHGERFWCSVMRVNMGSDGIESLDCFVDNDLLIYSKEFPYQAQIQVKPEQILEILK